jgi:hypothetical protein
MQSHHRQIQGPLGVGLATITQYLQLATAAGLDWAAAEPLEEDELERRILSPASPPAPTKRIEPHCNVIHRELQRKGVTLQLLWEGTLSPNQIPVSTSAFMMALGTACQVVIGCTQHVPAATRVGLV